MKNIERINGEWKHGFNLSVFLFSCIVVISASYQPVTIYLTYYIPSFFVLCSF